MTSKIEHPAVVVLGIHSLCLWLACKEGGCARLLMMFFCTFEWLLLLVQSHAAGEHTLDLPMNQYCPQPRRRVNDRDLRLGRKPSCHRSRTPANFYVASGAAFADRV